MVGSGLNEGEVKRGLDATVGGLVWVRRRNGSWWPGQIVGLDELPENDNGDGGDDGGGGGDGDQGSGTPIKLLGRDDSSVEWYDLETTKAVKTFRCGEYDSCIEKAKVTAAKFLKRSLKYPRREIAIYCALEIEKKGKDGANPDDHLHDEDHADCENGSVSMSRLTTDSKSSSEGPSSENTARACEENSNFTQELSHSGISHGGTNGFTSLKRKTSKGKRRKTPNDSEDDDNEGFKRMKGLNDLGVGSDVKKIHVLALTHSAPQISISVNGTHSTKSRALANGDGVAPFKKKRSQVVNIHELLKRNYRRRPMTKVSENTAMVPVRIICDEFANPYERSDAISPISETEDGKEKDDELLNRHLPEVDYSDSLLDVPFSDGEFPLSDFPPAWQPSFTLKPCVGALKGNSSRSFHIQAPSLEFEALEEPGPSCANGGSLKVGKNASKWQSKGKRKARFISKTDETRSSLRKSDAGNEKDAYATSLENPSPISTSSNGLLNGFTNPRKHMSVSTSSPRSFSYHQPHFLVPLSSELPDVSSLCAVEVTVETTKHQAQHVPYISLVSKLNGKPITGHPLTVEALENGFCDLQTLDYSASGSCGLNYEDAEMDFVIEPKARKTKQIKLRPHSSRRKVKSSRRKVKSSRRKGRGKPSKSKKRRGSSSKKTRKLSSLTGLHKLSAVRRKPVLESSNGPMLACVPLKIVFSRINEALNGSTRSAPRSMTLNTT